MNQKRQQLLLVAFAAMAALTFGDRLWQSLYAEPLEAAEQRVARLNKQIGEARQELKRYKKEQQRLEKLREASLPSDVEAARTLYQGWLTDVAEEVEMEGLRVDSNPPRSYEGFRALPFSLRCAGTLEQLTALLHQFYQTPLLHHIRTLTITPIGGSRELSLNFAIEALLIEGAPDREDLPSGKRNQLASDELEDYQAIARRNVFSASGGVEAAQLTALTAIVSVNGYPEAWFTNLLADEVEKVRQGDRFRVGALDCLVEHIGLRDVILAIEGERWLLTIDDRVADAIALPPEY